ncbi:MAG: glycoside hydrolase family 3 C-terminal domain-containing protein, partial [Anaerolineales bacterium]|nr:glycoside hydrolase family 3 C-terminal domain-containing protein [Anaerolineales bacterium]
ADVGLLFLGEEPYAEGFGDRADLHLPTAQIALLARMRQSCRRLVVVLVSGRPLILTAQLPLMDALVAAWLPGSEGQGVADVLFGDAPFGGRLPVSWPRGMDQLPLSPAAEAGALFPRGFGLV